MTHDAIGEPGSSKGGKTISVSIGRQVGNMFRAKVEKRKREVIEMNRNIAFSAALALALFSSGAIAQGNQSQPTMPPNTINCADWTHNGDGSWTAHKDARPFDLGKITKATMQDTTITAHAINMGGYDLWVVLNQKCGSM